MELWFLAPVGAVNILAWCLLIRYDEKITRSNDVPYFMIANILSVSAIVLFIIALAKLGLNSWERNASIDNLAYASGLAAIVSTALLFRPFIYEFRHRRDSIAPANITPFQIQGKKIRSQASADPPDDDPPQAA